MTASRPTAADWLAVGAGLTVFAYAGWDGALWDPRWQVLLHLLALGALGGMVAIALRGGSLPRTRIDLPALGLLAAYALATASAENPGLALRAIAAILATAAMLPAALVVLRHRPTATALVVAVPTIALAAGGAATQLGRRIEWVVAGAPGLPPVRLPSEGTPLGSVAVPPFVLLALVPLTMLIEPPRLRATVQVALALVAVPATLLSGSRSAWLAIAVAAVVFGTEWARRSRWRPSLPRRWSPGRIAVAGLLLAVGALSVAFVAPRVLALTSLVYRGNLWADTFAAWSSDPLLGIGPGTMPYARQAAAEAFSFPVRQPHSHNLPLGVLGDAGIVGLAAALVLVIVLAWTVAPWRTRGWAGLAAASVLAGSAVGGLFEDLTFLPNFNLLLLLVAAIALSDAGAVRWERPSLRRAGGMLQRAAMAASLPAIALLLAVAVTGDAAAVAYRAGTDAAGDADWNPAATWLRRSVELDPWHPTGPKALAIAADAAGNPALARDAAERAVELNGGDGPSWTNLALLCQRAGDGACAENAARRALETATLGGREAINAAYVLDAAGQAEAADDAYRLSLLTHRFTAMVADWPRPIDLAGADVAELDRQAADLNRLLGQRLLGATIDPPATSSAAVRALAHAFRGEDAETRAWLVTATEQEPASLLTWEVAIALRLHWDERIDEERRIYAAVRGSPLSDPDSEPRVGSLSFDIASFRAYPLDAYLLGAEHLVPDRAWPWSLVELLDPVGIVNRPGAGGAG